MKKENQPVAIVYHQCPLCLAKDEGEILIHKRLQDLSHLDRQIVGPSDEPCAKCQELMSLGLLVIEVDEHKTTDDKNPYRTGHQFVLKKAAAERIFAEVLEAPYPPKGVVFFSQEVVDHLGIREAMKEKEEANE